MAGSKGAPRFLPRDLPGVEELSPCRGVAATGNFPPTTMRSFFLKQLQEKFVVYICCMAWQFWWLWASPAANVYICETNLRFVILLRILLLPSLGNLEYIMLPFHFLCFRIIFSAVQSVGVQSSYLSDRHQVAT